MLYMIGIKGRKFIKVGFTRNYFVRRKSYASAMPSEIFEEIDFIEGGLDLEREIHARMIELGFEPDETAKEWMKIPKGVSKKFIKQHGFNFFLKIAEED